MFVDLSIFFGDFYFKAPVRSFYLFMKQTEIDTEVSEKTTNTNKVVSNKIECQHDVSLTAW